MIVKRPALQSVQESGAVLRSFRALQGIVALSEGSTTQPNE